MDTGRQTGDCFVMRPRCPRRRRRSTDDCYRLPLLSLRAVLPARRCASAGTSYGPESVCVCLCSIEMAERIELVFDMGTVLKGNSGISKMRVLHFGTLFQTPDLENFATATAYRSSKRVND